jgi:DNA-binding winged helix-turn-helix (wHTH) protein/tetratricopeptide (TPR) repeat protein
MTKQKKSYEFGLFRLDVAERRLLREGKPVPVAPKVFETLLVLVERPGLLVAKDELMSHLWPDSFVGDAALARNISDLRRALGESTDGQSYIETVPKSGYRFTAGVREIGLEDGELMLQRRTRSRVVVEEEIERDIRSIAVLPFRQLGANEGNEHLGLGLADALITRLSNIHQIAVRPTSAVLKYAASAHDPISAARELKVEAVLDGGIQRSGDRVRVTVQLIGLSAEAALWAGTFDEKFTDLFAVEDSISERVAQSLTFKLTGEEERLLAKRYTENTEAYQLYLKGRYYWNKRTGEGLYKGIEYFEEATRSDPNYALAYAGLADCYSKLGDVGIAAIPPKVAFSKAKLAAERALELDSSLAEAHASMGHLHLHHYDWLAAEKSVKRAIELSPNYATAHHWYAYVCALTGDPDGAIIQIKRAVELDPVSLIISTDLGELLYFARRFDEAVVQYGKVLEMDPNYFQAHHHLARAYEQKGMYAEAIEEFNRAIAISNCNSDTLASLAHCYAVSGRTREALDLLAQLHRLREDTYVSQYDLALVYLALGEEEKALEWLDNAFEEQSGWMAFLGVDPRLDPLRTKQGFRSLLRLTGLDNAIRNNTNARNT